MDNFKPITDKQKRYLKRLIKYYHQRLLEKDREECEKLIMSIEEIGIENLDIESAKKHIAKLLEFEAAYKEDYKKKAQEIDISDKIIDFSQYRKYN